MRTKQIQLRRHCKKENKQTKRKDDSHKKHENIPDDVLHFYT